MSLGNTEQIILDNIQADRNIREFWQGKIAEWRSEGKSEDDVAGALADKLGLIYIGTQSARDDLAGLVDYATLMTANYNSVAFALLGRDFRLEAVAAMIPPPAGWPEPYYLARDGKTLGPYSYAQIRIKWADEEITATDMAYHEPSGQWRPLQELVEPWTAEGYNTPPPPTSTPKAISETLETPEPKRTKGTKERPLQIAEGKFMLAIARAAEEIDAIFGRDKWELVTSSDYEDGCRCWTIKTEDTSWEKVWISSPGLATRTMSDGSPNLILDWISQEHISLYRKVAADVFRKIQAERAEAAAKAAKKPAEEEALHFSTLGGCGCSILLLAGIAILVFAHSMETRVWTVVVGIVSLVALSQYFANRVKKKNAEGKKP